MIGEPERYPGAAAPEPGHHAGHEERVHVDDDLAVGTERGPYDPVLGTFIQAWQRLAGQPCRAVDEPAAAAGTSRAKLGDHVAQALQRVAHVLGKVVRAHWPDDTDPRHGSPQLL